jgi:hypothetical protein
VIQGLVPDAESARRDLATALLAHGGATLFGLRRWYLSARDVKLRRRIVNLLWAYGVSGADVSPLLEEIIEAETDVPTQDAAVLAFGYTIARKGGYPDISDALAQTLRRAPGARGSNR